MARLIFALLCALMSVSANLHAQVLMPSSPPVDAFREFRQCGQPARDARGAIKRNSAVIDAYKRLHPCPATGLSTGACPGWQINHTIPLVSGGCDSVINMSWLPLQIKTCTSAHCVDRWERTYYRAPHGKVTLPASSIQPFLE